MSTAAEPSTTQERPQRQAQPLLPRWVSFGVMPFALAAAISMAASAYLYVHARNAAAVPSPMVQLMGLSDGSGHPAPGFTLTDQHGRPVSLSSFRGKAVLVAFMDSRCTQVCPVLAQEFLLAQHDLGRAAPHVAFVGVNVDPMGESVAAVEHFTQLHGLSRLPNWYFLTGPTAALKAVWSAYGIQVFLPKGATQTVHADYLYFLGPHGRERYIASPQVDQRKNGTGYLPQSDLNKWGRGIATYLRRSLAK
ncbi:MAG: SCO family protein [Actinomycetota bacterium]|nr:SCO family protein [Actinomycetota bacterium]